LDVVAFFGKLIGALPRGDFQKFQRTIYPVMVEHANLTNRSVYSFWFGDVIRVGPGGGWGSIGLFNGIIEAKAKFQEQADKEGVVYWLSCAPGLDANSPSDIAAKCTFIKLTGSLGSRVLSRFFPAEPEFTPVPDLTRQEEGDPFFVNIDLKVPQIPSQAPSRAAPAAAGLFGGPTGVVLILGGIVVLALLFKKK